MYLTEALHRLTDDDIHRIASLIGANTLDTPSPIHAVEVALKSYRVMNKVLMNCMPPTFSVLKAILDTDTKRLPRNVLETKSLESFESISKMLSDGKILTKKSGANLYKKVLLEARRSDLEINTSEEALLSVLRHELELSTPDHFLTEYRQEFAEFWRSLEISLPIQLKDLCSYGILYEFDGMVILPLDLAAIVSNCLGIEINETQTLNLLNRLTLEDLNEANALLGFNLYGNKDEKVRAILNNFVSPSALLDRLSGESLREICRSYSFPTSGSKGEVTERIILGIRSNATKDTETQKSEPLPVEDRFLEQERFKSLFKIFRGHQLRDILQSIPHATRCTGSKQLLIDRLWDIHLSERTLLSHLTNDILDRTLLRLNLKTLGPKNEKIQRIVEFIKTSNESTLVEIFGLHEKEEEGVEPSM